MDISMSSKDDEIMKFCKFKEKQMNSVNDNVKQLFKQAAKDEINSENRKLINLED